MEPVENVNALTRRWLSEQGEASTVLSGAGVWPLLGFLLEAANQPGRAELQGTLDVESGGGAKAAGALLEIMKSIPAVRVALGLWTDPRLPLNQEWVGRLPLGTSQRLTGDPAADQKRLDAWASEHTEGLIPQFPATVDSGTLLLLASALLVQTTWIQPFDESRYQVPDGPWAGRTVDALQHTTSVLDRVRVATTPLGPVTALTVMGSDDIDVSCSARRSGRQPRCRQPVSTSSAARFPRPPATRFPRARLDRA
jgi:hypothetical protein